MNPMDFDEWDKLHCLVGHPEGVSHCKAKAAWEYKQQEVDELKQENEFLKDRARCAPYENAKFSVMAIRRLEQKNAELEKKLSDAQWDFQEGDIVVKELESRCKQLQGLVDEIAHKYIMQHFDYDLNERLQLSATKREATCKQSLQVQKEDK